MTNFSESVAHHPTSLSSNSTQNNSFKAAFHSRLRHFQAHPRDSSGSYNEAAATDINWAS